MGCSELQIIVLASDPGAGRAPPGERARPQGAPPLPLLLSRASAVAGHAVTVVLGARAAAIAPGLGRAPVSLVVDRDWSEGIAASIRAGLKSLPGSCDGALLLRADQSGVTSADLQRLVDAWRRNPRAIIAAQFGGGHDLPAIFPRSEFPALLALRGEQGARALLRHPAMIVVGVPMPAAASAAGQDAQPLAATAP
jgi:molybdenum cofactor cytidylyltransferase